MFPATGCEQDADCSALLGNFRCTDFGDAVGAADLIGGILWPKKKDSCEGGSTSVCKNSGDVEPFNCDSTRCNSELFKSELGHVFTSYQNGQSYDENVQSLKFCTPHLEAIRDEISTFWSKQQYSVVGYAYTIAGMRDANVSKIEFCAADGYPDQTDAPSPSVAPSPPVASAAPPPATFSVIGTMTLDGEVMRNAPL